MSAIPNIIPVSDLRQDAAEIIKSVNQTNEPVFITQRGRASAVLVGLQSYELLQKKLEILTLFARGEKEISSGEGFDFDEVMSELKLSFLMFHELMVWLVRC